MRSGGQAAAKADLGSVCGSRLTLSHGGRLPIATYTYALNCGCGEAARVSLVTGTVGRDAGVVPPLTLMAEHGHTFAVKSWEDVC